MLNYNYLTKEHLKGLDLYKYNAIDTSPLGKYVMHPFWNFIVKGVPAWIAPNVLTMAGFLCLVANLLILLTYNYYYDIMRRTGSHAEDPIPYYVYIGCSISVLLAYNLDGIDGKHARRLCISGPLGELFDHGVDSYTIFLILFCNLFCFSGSELSPSVLRAYAIVVSITMNSYITHAEKYITGTLYLPWGYDISMWASSLIMLAPGLSRGVYRRYMFWNITPFDVLEVITHLLGLGITISGTVYRIWWSYKMRTIKQNSMAGMLRPLWAILSMSVSMTVWAMMSPNILEREFITFLLLYGTMFSCVTTRLIVSCMSSRHCELICWMNWPLLISIVVSFYKRNVEVFMLYALLVLFLLSHIHYGTRVVQQICGHFNIPCFTVHEDKRTS